MNLRNKNGSITIFVLVGLLFMSAFLLVSYANNVNRSKIAKEQIDIIKDIYGKNMEDRVQDIYSKAASIPEIKVEISQTTGGVMNIGITLNGMTDEPEVEKYKFNGETKYSKEELYKYIEVNNLYDVEKELEITIINDIKNKTEFKEIVKFVKPTINELPSEFGVESMEESETYIEYVEYDEKGGTTEYIAFDQSFSTIKKLVAFVRTNNKYEKTNVTINAKGNNNLNSTLTKEVTFIKIAAPIIGTIPTPIITNVTQVNESYVTYDDLGRKEEIYKIVEVPELTFDTMIDVVNFANTWLIENKQYEVDVNIQIVAKGNNNLTSESTQPVKFMRGTTVASEEDLINALYSTTPSYIKLETSNGNNEIICNSPITLDGVSHKLDLNGNTISYTVNSAAEGSTLKFLTVGPNANLTVMDSTEEGKGGIVFNVIEEITADGNDRETKIMTVDNQGVVNIESGIIEANISRKMGNDAKKDGNVHDTGVAIENSGTVNLNGGTILTNVVTQSCSYMTIQISEAVAKGIINNGTINVASGTINTNAEAYAVQPSGAIWKGKTWAYAYGIENNGTINNSENITFSTTATAHKENSREQKQEALDIS